MAHCRAGCGRESARQAEVRYHRVPRLYQNVLGFDVAVHDAFLMRVGQRIGHLARDLEGVWKGELRLVLEPLAQGFPRDVRHDVVKVAVRLPGVIQRKNVGMGEARDDLDLTQEPLAAHGEGELGK